MKDIALSGCQFTQKKCEPFKRNNENGTIKHTSNQVAFCKYKIEILFTPNYLYRKNILNLLVMEILSIFVSVTHL